jgi:hypothetical protein
MYGAHILQEPIIIFMLIEWWWRPTAAQQGVENDQRN